MAISLPHSTASPEPYTSEPEPSDWLVVSLTQGWDQVPPEQGGGRSLAAGDLVILAVATSPDEPVICPSGWTQNGHAFWKIISPAELNPLFRCRKPVLWAWQGQAYAGLASSSV